MNMLDLVVKYWPALIMLGGITTTINRLVQLLPARFARLKNVVNTVTVDFAALLLEVGGALKIGPRTKPEDKGPTPPMAGMLIVALLLSGCAGSFEEARGSVRMGVSGDVVQRCFSLDDAHRNWGATAKGSAALAGVSALGSALEHDNQTARLSLAGAGIGLGALAAFAVVESDGAATSWARECH